MLIESNFSVQYPRGFLVFDGVNGAGKSTLLRTVSAYLQKVDFEVLETREPGATDLGKKLREILLLSKEWSLPPLSELFLFAADRSNHVSNVIRPALQKDKLVLSDRYYYSTTAFQGHGRGLDLNLVEQINSIAIQNTLPDFVVLLDLDPNEGLRRNQQDSDKERDGFEEEELAFHTRLRNGFLEIANNAKEPFFVIDASQTPEQIFAQLKPLLDSWIESLRT